MKSFTEALINDQRKKKSLKTLLFGQNRMVRYYQANHREEDVYLLWIEANRFGRLYCYPCVFRRDGEGMVFENGVAPGGKVRNQTLVDTWTRTVTPQTVGELFVVSEMAAPEFQEVFGRYRREMVDKAIAEAQKEDMEALGQTPELKPEAEGEVAQPAAKE